jgi:hypothetical protein
MSAALASSVFQPRWNTGILVLLLICAGSYHPVVAQGVDAADAPTLFARGLTWTQFLESAKAQRERWVHVTANAAVPTSTVERIRRVSAGLRILAVAEDWCPDSVNTLPYVARLASSLPVPLRIVDRTAGEPLMRRHRTPDGRMATPTIVLLRGVDEVAAWVERPAVVQQWFLSMATSPENASRFGSRQSWYDADRGQSLLAELTALAEQSAK